MPLTPFQVEILRLIAPNRRPESHVGGGSVLFRAADSPRVSEDLDIFNDYPALAEGPADQDARVLLENGYSLEWTRRTDYICQALVRKSRSSLRLDWLQSSPCRFYPVQKDPDFGYCLHIADMATNKAMAMSNRREARDYFDVVFLHLNYLSLGALVWAACGKDDGLTPDGMLDDMTHHSSYQRQDYGESRFFQVPDLVAMRRTWMVAVEEARVLFGGLPPEELGALYLRADGKGVTPDPTGADFSSLTRRFAVRGGGSS